MGCLFIDSDAARDGVTMAAPRSSLFVVILFVIGIVLWVGVERPTETTSLTNRRR